jgi:hypothetical protein
MTYFRGDFSSRAKPDGSIVTDADEAVEDALRVIPGNERPDDAVLGEERGLTGRGRARGSSTASMARTGSPKGLPDRAVSSPYRPVPTLRSASSNSRR